MTTKSDPEVYYVLESSRDNPDNGPGDVPSPEQGGDHPGAMWVWWRTGPHPQGVWQVMDTRSEGWSKAYQANEDAHPIMQDQALSSPGDWGHRVCHACGEMSEGYPEPRHRTACAGLCKRPICAEHGDEIRSETPDRVLYVSHEEYEYLMKALDEPPKELPRLRALMEEHKKQAKQQ